MIGGNSVQILVNPETAKKMEATFDEYAEIVEDYAPELKQIRGLRNKLDTILIYGHLSLKREIEQQKKNETPGAATPRESR